MYRPIGTYYQLSDAPGGATVASPALTGRLASQIAYLIWEAYSDETPESEVRSLPLFSPNLLISTILSDP